MDRGRVIGEATIVARARRADPPPTFDAREYPHMVEPEIASLASLRQGVELAPHVRCLSRTFPDPKTWSVRMRRALVPLDPRDAELIARELSNVAGALRGRSGNVRLRRRGLSGRRAY